jgi:hypothetical protein
MKKFFLAVLILFGHHCQAQEDFPDTRVKHESFLKLPKNEIRSELASFTLGGISESVGKGDMKKISFGAHSASSMAFEEDNIKAVVTTAPFDASKHKLQWDDEKYLIKIDRRTYYGGYPNLPKTYINLVQLIIDKDTVAIPAAAYSDLYNLNLTYQDKGRERSTNAIYLSKYGNRVYFYLFCKDQTGSYEVTFVIQDKKYVRRVLDYGIL